MSLKHRGDLCVLIMKNDAKFETELTCHFKADMRNLINFDTSTQKSQKFIIQSTYFDQNIYNVSAKKVQRSYV